MVLHHPIIYEKGIIYGKGLDDLRLLRSKWTASDKIRLIHLRVKDQKSLVLYGTKDFDWNSRN